MSFEPSLPGMSDHDELHRRWDAALAALPIGSGRLFIEAMHAHREWVNSKDDDEKGRRYHWSMLAFLEQVGGRDG